MAIFDIDGELIRKLAGLLDETGLTEIEFAEGEQRIRVSKSAPQTVLAAAPASAVGAVAHPGALTSPMVGTAYVASEPGGAPFVRVGDAVKAGQTMLIIEAMKVMNPIKAPKGGTVSQIFVSDGQPVEFAEVLMIIE
jgi:acetyl-CoA carboxylase biotin carboxyl carrier protein